MVMHRGVGVHLGGPVGLHTLAHDGGGHVGGVGGRDGGGGLRGRGSRAAGEMAWKIPQFQKIFLQIWQKNLKK